MPYERLDMLLSSSYSKKLEVICRDYVIDRKSALKLAIDHLYRKVTTPKRLKKSREVNIESQVESIIKNKGPVLTQRVHYDELKSILESLNRKLNLKKYSSLDYLRGLKPYDFPGTKLLWKEGGTELAYEAIRAWAKGKTNGKGNFLRAVADFTMNSFMNDSINRFNTNLSSLVNGKYMGSAINAFIDWFHNDEDLWTKKRKLAYPWITKELLRLQEKRAQFISYYAANSIR